MKPSSTGASVRLSCKQARFAQQQDDREDHRRGADDGRADEHRLGRRLERVAGRVVRFEVMLALVEVGLEAEVPLDLLLDAGNALGLGELENRSGRCRSPGRSCRRRCSRGPCTGSRRPPGRRRRSSRRRRESICASSSMMRSRIAASRPSSVADVATAASASASAASAVASFLAAALRRFDGFAGLGQHRNSRGRDIAQLALDRLARLGVDGLVVLQRVRPRRGRVAPA